jgi:autotransporter translocation and assembly factor TamB
MKKLLSVFAWTLALNFLAAAGGVAYLYKSGALNREKVQQIKELVFAPATQPVEPAAAVRDPSTRPTLALESLLANVSGRSASEQVEFIHRTFDAQNAILDNRFADLTHQRLTVEQAQEKLTKDRAALAAAQKKLELAQAEQDKAQTDKGFQDTLALYTSMPAKQVKTVFMSLTDDTMIQYLRAMEPRVATKIVKEFKSPDETARISTVMEKMRQAQASVSP